MIYWARPLGNCVKKERGKKAQYPAYVFLILPFLFHSKFKKTKNMGLKHQPK